MFKNQNITNQPFFLQCLQLLFAFGSFVGHDGDEIVADVMTRLTGNNATALSNEDKIGFCWV